MRTLEQAKECGAKACAQRMYQDGQGQESNPYHMGSGAYMEFALEMTRLQAEEFKQMMQGGYV